VNHHFRVIHSLEFTIGPTPQSFGSSICFARSAIFPIMSGRTPSRKLRLRKCGNLRRRSARVSTPGRARTIRNSLHSPATHSLTT
jgi:hypothetical protein